MPVLLRLQWMRKAAQAKSRRLLRILLIRIGTLPAGPAKWQMWPSKARAFSRPKMNGKFHFADL